MNPYKKKVLEARKKILQLTIEQEKQINNIYAKSAARLIDEILELPDISRTRVHDIDIARLLNDYTKDLYKQLYPSIKDNIMESSIIQRQVILDYVDQVAKDRKLSEIVKHNINNYSNTVVKNLVAGEYYKDGKTLSKRLWNLTSDNSNKIDEFIKMNIASGANARKLANDLELLINPNNRIVTNNFKAGFNSYKISYQAQRLARTSITHAATETQIQNAKKNPFSKGLRWNLSASHSTRMHGKTDICDDYNGQIFKPEETPLQHPNCLCYFTEEVVEVDNAIARINKWVEGNEDKELDSWSTELNNDEDNIKSKTSDPVKVNEKDVTINLKFSDNNKYNNISSDSKEQEVQKIFKHSISNVEWNSELGITLENSNILNDIHTKLNEFIINEGKEKINLLELSNNKICIEQVGEKEKVQLSKETLKILKESSDNDIIFVHNHPGKTTFSRDDIEKIISFKSIKAMTLECEDGSKYLIERGSCKSSSIKGYLFYNKYENIRRKIEKKYPELNDEIKIYYIWDEFMNEVAKTVCNKYGLIYKKVN